MTIDGIEVKPCPYCGNTGPSLYHFGHGFIIHCGRYFCDQRYSYIGATEKDCVIAWNRDCDEIIKKYKEIE